MSEAFGDSSVDEVIDTYKATGNLPKRFYLKGKGRGRVLSYNGNGFFTILPDKGPDVPINVHRSHQGLVFIS